MTGTYTFYFNNSAAAGFAVEAGEQAGLICKQDGNTVGIVAESYASQFGQSYVGMGDRETCVAQNVALTRIEANGLQIWPPSDE